VSRAGYSPSEPVVELENVTAGYWVAGARLLRREFHGVLRGVSLTIRSGERVAVIGESGSGKTTLLRVVLGVLPPVSGRVRVLGHELYRMPERERWKVTRMIGYVPQDPSRALNPRLRVVDIVTEPLARTRLSKEEKLERARWALRMVRLHESVLSYYPTQLSGGMMQRVLIARAIVHEPKLLLLDEPTSALDVSVQAQVINLLNDIQQALRCTMVTVTHDLSVAQYLADRAVLLHGGTIVEDSPFDVLVSNPRSQYAVQLVRSYLLAVAEGAQEVPQL